MCLATAPCTSAAEQKTSRAKRYFLAMRDAVATLMSQGKSLNRVTKSKVPSEFAHYTHPERLRSRRCPLYYWELMGVDR